MIKESRIDHHQHQIHKPELLMPIKAAIKQFQSEFPQTACITLSIMRLGIRRRCVNIYRFQSVFLVTETYSPNGIAMKTDDSPQFRESNGQYPSSALFDGHS